MGYTTDDEEGPAGEILIRGPNVSRGYLHLDDKTYAGPSLLRHEETLIATLL
jgi:acyl-CoA synthetase (AMP-forming)/AMP-acid ligase II